jgi:ABC-type uncharacterized transport system permease subunit
VKPSRQAPQLLDLSAEARSRAAVESARGRNRISAKLIQAVFGLGIATAAVAVAFLVGALVLQLDGRSPLAAFSAMWQGALGTPLAIGNTMNRAAILLLPAVGFILAYRTGLLNVGAEGHIYVGGAAAAAVALAMGSGVNSLLVIPLALAAAATAGGALSLFSGALKVARKVPEVLSTLMLNFIAIQFVSYLVSTPGLLQEKHVIITQGTGYSTTSRNFPQSSLIPEVARLPRWIEGTSLHIGIFIGVLAALFVIMLLGRTILGFRFRMVGSGITAARQAGVNVNRVILSSMALCGALGGLAGASLVLGDRFRILDGISPGFGYLGILVALMARASPIGAIAAAILFAGMQLGGQVMEAGGHAPQSIVLFVQGLVVVAVASTVELERRWMRRVERQGG